MRFIMAILSFIALAACATVEPTGSDSGLPPSNVPPPVFDDLPSPPTDG